MGVIYKISNDVNDTVYIGETVNFEERIAAHLYMLKAGKHHNAALQDDYNKLGSEHFNYEVVDDLGDVDKSVLLEYQDIHIRASSGTYNTKVRSDKYKLKKDSDKILIHVMMTQQEIDELISCVCEVSGFEKMKNAQALRYCITFFKRHHDCTKIAAQAADSEAR